MKNKSKNHLKPVIVIISLIFFIISFSLNFNINLGASLVLLFIIGAAVYRLGADSSEKRLYPFETWVRINLDENKERLSDIDDKIYEIEGTEYDISQDAYTPQSKNELVHKLKEEKEIIDARIKELEKAFLDAEEEIPE